METGRELRVARITDWTDAAAGGGNRRSVGFVGLPRRARSSAGGLARRARSARRRCRAEAVREDLSRWAPATGRRAARAACSRSTPASIRPGRARLEVVVPIEGDLRAADEVIRTDACSCAGRGHHAPRRPPETDPERAGQATRPQGRSAHPRREGQPRQPASCCVRPAGSSKMHFRSRRAKRFAHWVPARTPAAIAWLSSDPVGNCSGSNGWARAPASALSPSVLRRMHASATEATCWTVARRRMPV